jgi:hypothetical protein
MLACKFIDVRIMAFSHQYRKYLSVSTITSIVFFSLLNIPFFRHCIPTGEDKREIVLQIRTLALYN